MKAKYDRMVALDKRGGKWVGCALTVKEALIEYEKAVKEVEENEKMSFYDTCFKRKCGDRWYFCKRKPFFWPLS